MKDHFGKEIVKGDLVVCMAIGRYSGMATGIATNNKGGVRYERGGSSGGTSNQVRIECIGNPEMTELRLNILDKFRELDQQKKDADKKDKEDKLKLADLKLYGVYSTDNYSNEIRIGSITIGDTEYKNCWAKIYKADYKIPISKDNYKAELVYSRDSWRRKAGDVDRNMFRDCKYPKKLREHFVLSEEEVKELLGSLAGGLRNK